MNQDSPDTIAMDETQWVATQVDDVFLPSVRVQLSWRDLEAAVARGAIVPTQAHALWAGWAAPGGGMRVGSSGLAPSYAPTLVESSWGEVAERARPGLLQRHYGQVLGLLVGAALGAAGVYIALGG